MPEDRTVLRIGLRVLPEIPADGFGSVPSIPLESASAADPDPENNSATQEYTGPIVMPAGSTIFSFVLQDQKGRLSDVTRRNYELNTD